MIMKILNAEDYNSSGQTIVTFCHIYLEEVNVMSQTKSLKQYLK